MALKILRFASTNEAEFTLNGGIASGASIGGRIMGLHGKTLIFIEPAGTVTFSDATGVGLSPSEVQTQVQAVHAGLKVQFVDRYMRIIEDVPATGVCLDKDGTANSIFGFSTSADTIGVRYGSLSGGPPLLVSLQETATRDGYLAVVETA